MPMKRLTTVLACAAVLLMSLPASANDSVASMGAGGLVLQRTEGITMVSEDLFVSAREVRVTYRFLNHTTEGISTIVAFPMPDIAPGYAGDVGGRLDDPAHIVPFITWVDDRAVWTDVEYRAVVDGVDITDRLRALNLPLPPHGQDSWDAVNALPDSVRRTLTDEGILDSGRKPDGTLDWSMPNWTLKTTHYWTQWFPPGEPIEITHLYAPAIGGTVMTMVGRADSPMDEYRETYCLDETVIDAARRAQANGRAFSETWLDYILTTGANWSGPIGDFRLVVDKGSTDNLVSFCGDGVRRIGPTTFEVRHANYTPTRDLNVLILQGDRSH
ncbi:MAG: hypothetical protein ACI9YM_001052 [Brevundimonas sp.]|jgi:hypothetical protein